MHIELVTSLKDVPSSDWDALTGDHDPFCEHAFLQALEESGSVGGESGWTPVHVTVHDGTMLVGALPLYAKTHSYGEYIFDFGWANAAHQMRLRYYPKLVSMTPFTPATGQRFLVHPDRNRDEIVDALLLGVDEAVRAIKASSVHLLFLNEDEREFMRARRGYAPRASVQFHWHNQGDKAFDDYLQRFRSESRKQVRRERRKVAESGLRIREVRGGELTSDEWSLLDQFYRDTCARKGSEPYLSETFFECLRASNAKDRLVAVLAEDGEKLVAATINFEKGAHLYGRYWGALEAYDSLHFELCYYRLIERAIRLGHTRFEAGAQGIHKLKRGLLPARVSSSHRIENERLREAVFDYVAREAMGVDHEIAELMKESPFHREHKDEPHE